MIWMSLFLILQLFTLLALCKGFCTFHPSTSKPVSTFAKYSTIICIIFTSLSTAVDIAHTLLAYLADEPSSNTQRFGIWLTAADIAYFSSSVFLYILIIGKLYVTFRKTNYEISRKYMVFLAFLVSILVFCMTEYLYLLNSHKVIVFLNKSLSFIYGVVFSDITIMFIILALFTYKLQQLLNDTMDSDLVHGVDQTDDGSLSTRGGAPVNRNISDTVDKYTRKSISQVVHENTDQYNKRMEQKRLIKLVMKQTLLGTIMIFLNGLFYFKVLIDIYSVNNTTFKSDIAFQTSHCLRAFMNFIVIYLLYLNFHFNTKLYYKSCGCLHKGCYSCCLRCTGRRITKPTMNMNIYHRL